MTIYLKPQSHPHHGYEQIAQQIHHIIKETLPNPIKTHPNYHQWAKEHDTPEQIAHQLQHHIAYIAVNHNQTIGSIILNPETNEISHLYVNPYHHNKGIGRTLLAHIHAPAILNTLNHSTLHIITKENHHKARSLFLRNNYITSPAAPHHLFPDIPQIKLQKQISL